MFHQVEGLVIDRDTHMGHLKWVLEEFCKAFFEVNDVKMRFRMSHFPFTEPSAEVDIQCDRSGAELKIGEGNDWLEILGCGMVHPECARGLRHRSRGVAGLRLRHGHRPHRHAEIRHARPARFLRRRPALAEALRVQPACDSFARRWSLGMMSFARRGRRRSHLPILCRGIASPLAMGEKVGLDAAVSPVARKAAASSHVLCRKIESKNSAACAIKCLPQGWKDNHFVEASGTVAYLHCLKHYNKQGR